VTGIGTHEAVLWGVLPVAILLAAYAPRAISFAAGQAGFTVVLFVLFNIIQPVGWRVGVVRVEDVAIGFAISLGVGLLFWPRGAGRRRLAGSPGRAVALDARADGGRRGAAAELRREPRARASRAAIVVCHPRLLAREPPNGAAAPHPRCRGKQPPARVHSPGG